MDGLLEWRTDIPTLRRPVLVVALEGFVDAGGVASTAALFLRHRWQSDHIATFARDEFVDFRARRPTVVVDGGLLRRVEWPDIELHAAHVDGPHDAVLLLGPEPDMRWAAFSDAVAQACASLGIHEVVGLGAYPAAAPHTRPVRILQASNTVEGTLETGTGKVPGYTGPVGMSTVLQHTLGEVGLPAVGLWAEVPHYISSSPNPAGALALVRVVAQALQTSVDTTELEAAAKLHAEQVAEAVAEHPEAEEMVAALERHVDEGDSDQALPTGEDLAAEIERFLRSQ